MDWRPVKIDIVAIVHATGVFPLTLYIKVSPTLKASPKFTVFGLFLPGNVLFHHHLGVVRFQNILSGHCVYGYSRNMGFTLTAIVWHYWADTLLNIPSMLITWIEQGPRISILVCATSEEPRNILLTLIKQKVKIVDQVLMCCVPVKSIILRSNLFFRLHVNSFLAYYLVDVLPHE